MIWEHTHGPEMALELVAVDVLREDIRRIILSGDLRQAKVLRAQPLLDPEVRRVEMADFAKSTALTNPDRRRRVAANLQGKLNAQIFRYAL